MKYWDTVDAVYTSELERVEKNVGLKIIASHFGEFSQDFVYSFCDEFEKILYSKGDNKMIVKRIFSILLEGMQNVRLHGDKDSNNTQKAYLIVAESESYYKIIIANLIGTAIENQLIAYLNDVNSYDIQILKNKYLSMLKEEFDQQRGGGLGIITTRLKSGNELMYSVHHIEDETALFSFKVVVDR